LATTTFRLDPLDESDAGTDTHAEPVQRMDLDDAGGPLGASGQQSLVNFA
jgi:hypothetical protein